MYVVVVSNLNQVLECEVVDDDDYVDLRKYIQIHTLSHDRIENLNHQPFYYSGNKEKILSLFG